MANGNLDSIALQDYLDRWRAGDTKAADELLRLVMARLEKLANRMLRSFPNIRNQVETEDVLQNSLLRLLHTLHRLKPKTTRDFVNLAAVQIRRELLDIARKARRKRTVSLQAVASEAYTTPGSQRNDEDDGERWVSFHKAIDRLPVEEREVVGLVFYHGWKQQQIADLFQVDARTIRRYWAAACAHLKSILGCDFFEKC